MHVSSNKDRSPFYCLVQIRLTDLNSIVAFCLVHGTCQKENVLVERTAEDEGRLRYVSDMVSQHDVPSYVVRLAQQDVHSQRAFV